MFIAYITLFIAFIMVVTDNHKNSTSTSEWVLENFSVTHDNST